MTKRIITDRYYKKADIPEPIALIDGSNTDYVSTSGRIFKYISNYDLFYEKKTRINEYNGYVYCGITMSDGRNKSHRVHRLVAKKFIENENNYDIVGHKNNIKHDNRVENLYWTTVSENTKKAFNDGLAANAKGFDDSQSNPVDVYDANMNYIKTYGSMILCHKELGVSVSTISRQCKGQIKTKTRCGYIFRYHNK